MGVNVDKVYIVVKQGVYRHNIMGIYMDVEQAKLRAINVAGSSVDDYRDGDGYHEFLVCTAPVGFDIGDVQVLYVFKREVSGSWDSRVYGKVKEVKNDY